MVANAWILGKSAYSFSETVKKYWQRSVYQPLLDIFLLFIVSFKEDITQDIEKSSFGSGIRAIKRYQWHEMGQSDKKLKETVFDV